MKQNEANISGFKASRKILSFILAVAILFTILPGGIISPVEVSAASYNINSGPITIAAGSGDHVITGSGQTGNNITISNGYTGTITLSGVNISNNSDTPAILVNGNGNNTNPSTKVDFILDGTNTLQSKGNYATFHVAAGAQISINSVDRADNSSGSLVAKQLDTTGNYGGAGIGGGGGSQSDTTKFGGNIQISSGTITATAAQHGAGIGGGWGAYNGYVVVNGGKVTCYGGAHGAGIGGGCLNTGAGSRPANDTYGTGVVAVFPPADVTAKGGSGDKYAVGNVKEAVYIGDPKSPALKVRTETNEKDATIYCDLSSVASIITAYNAMGLDINGLYGVKFGKTDSTGFFTTNALLNNPTTFYTDASSTQAATFGRPFTPAQGRTVSNANADVVLPLSTLNIKITYVAPTALLKGYTSSEAASNSASLVLEYQDTKVLKNVSFNVTDGTHFENLEIYDATNNKLTSFPTTLNNGDKYTLRLPLKTGKDIALYNDFIKIKYTYFDDTANKDIDQTITQPVDQKVVMQDTTNKYIKVTANPVSFTSNLNPQKVVVLSLNINHTGLTEPYDKDSVEAYYIISKEKNYADIDPADTNWKAMTIPATASTNANTNAIFASATAEGTYYIHWKVTSGLVMANSKDFPTSGTAPTYGAFGEYIVDKKGPKLVISGPSTTQTGAFDVFFTFDKANVTGFVAGDITVANGTITSGPTLDPSSPAGKTQYKATILPSDLPSGDVTIGVKKSSTTPNISATDAAGNKVTDPVADLVVPFTNTVSYILTKSSDFSYTYGTTTVPSVTMTVNNTGQAQLVPDGTTVTLSGADAAKFSVVQPTGNVPVSGSKTFALSVVSPSTIDVGTYTVDVKVKYKNGTEVTTPVTLTVTKAGSGLGKGGTVTANPSTNTAATPRKTTAVTLTPNAGANNSVVSWKYKIYTAGTTPPATWTEKTGGAPANEDFPGTGVYSIDWEIVNSNYSDTSGTLTPFHIDQVRPKIDPALNVAPSAVGAGQFEVELTFDKDIKNISTVASNWMGATQNCTIAGVMPKLGSQRTFTVKVLPSASTANGAKVGFTVLENKFFDFADNGNEAYNFEVTFNSSSPYVVNHDFPTPFTGNIYNAVTSGNFKFNLKSNASGSDKTLYDGSGAALAISNIGSYVEVKRGGATLTAGTDYTLTYTAGTDAGSITVVPTGTGFGEGAYTITIKSGIKNKEGNAMESPYTQNFEVRVPTVSGTSAFTVAPPNLSYAGGSVTVKMTGTNLQYAANNAIKFEVQDPGAGSFAQLAVNPTIVVASDGKSATYTYTLPLNSTNTAKTYTYKASLNGVAVGSNETCIVAAATPDWSGADHGIKANPTSFTTYVGGNTNLTVKGLNLHNYSDLKIQVMDGTTPVTTISIPVSDLQPSGESTVIKTQLIPNNMTSAEKNYTFTLFDGVTDLSTTSAGSKAKVTVKIAAATPQITDFNGAIGGKTGTSLTTDEMGGTLTLKLDGAHLHNFNPLDVTVQKDGAALTTLSATAASGASTQSYTFTLPENTTQTDQTYEFEIRGHKVTVVVQSAAIDLNGTGYGLTAVPENFNFRGGTAKLILKGKNLYHYTNLKLVVDKNGTAMPDIAITTTAHGEVTLTANQFCARNDSDQVDVYTFKLFDGTTDLGKSATVKVAASVPEVTAFTVSDSSSSAGNTSLELDDNGGTVHFTIDGQHLHNFTTMQIDGTPAVGTIVLSGLGNDNDKGITSVVLPANRTLADQVYTYTLKNAGSERTVTITVKKPEVGPNAVTATPPELSAAGGSSTIDITGKNMEIASLELRSKDNPSEIHTMPTTGTHVSSSQVTLGFSGHSGGLRNDIYEYEVYFDGQATGLTTTVEVGDSVPNITGFTAVPDYFGSVNDTLNGNGRSALVIDGNYLFNFSSIEIYDRIYDRMYTVDKVGKDMQAQYVISVPSAVGVYTYDLFCDGIQTTFSVEIRVGVSLGQSSAPTVTTKEEENTNKYWSRRGGGSKGGGFTGRKYVPFDVLEYQCEVAAKEDPVNPTVILADIGYLVPRHFALAWAGGHRGARLSSKQGDGIVTLIFDTTTRDDETVLEGRLYFEVDKMKPTVYPGVFVDEVETGDTRKLFESRFENQNLAVICLDQDGDYGTTVEVAAAVDLTGFNTDSLYLYRYDRETGKYEPMSKTEHFVDTKDFLHFMTTKGGDIIVTDKPLTEKGGKIAETGLFVLEAKKDKKAGGIQK